MRAKLGARKIFCGSPRRIQTIAAPANAKGYRMTSARKGVGVIRVPDFWDAFPRDDKKLLALDYDGTLAPFRTERMAARPLPGIEQALKRLQKSKHTTLAIVSGRPLFELSALLGDIDILMVGSHGFELRRPGGEILVRSPNPRQTDGLDRAEAEILKMDFGKCLERKVASTAFHTRALAAARAAAATDRVRSLWSRLALEYDLSCRLFNGGVELRATGWHKGDAVMSLLAESRATFSVYIGDDETDEDVFRSLRGRGIGILVGEPTEDTAARGFLPDCGSVRTFLRTWFHMET